MSANQEQKRLIILIVVFISLVIPGIVLLSLLHRGDVVANTRGYIVPGGDCQIICGGIGDYDNCVSAGIINVSFYAPGTDDILYYAPTEAPFICEHEMPTYTVCCQEFIQSHKLLWIQVEETDDSFNVTHISGSKIENISSYLILGIMFTVASILPLCCLIFIICKEQCNNFKYRLLN